MATPLWFLYKKSFLSTCCILVLFFVVFMRPTPGHCVAADAFKSCGDHITQYEVQHQIPAGLMHAISKVESGRKDATGHIVAWPWTVNAAGQGYYFPTKEAAIFAVQKMQAQGIQSIDIGCMQVNLYHHPQAFKTLEEAFDPATNVAYAARFLIGLKKVHLSWNRAIAHYHSANPLYHIPYQKNVLNAWDRDIKNGGIYLTAGVFESIAAQNAKPVVNRIRRLSKVRTLSLNEQRFSLPPSKAVVRRVIRGNTAHIRRI